MFYLNILVYYISSDLKKSSSSESEEHCNWQKKITINNKYRKPNKKTS